MRTLTFKYRKSSSLPRRTFIVNVETWNAPTSPEFEYLAFDVTAPDPLVAENIVRITLRNDPSVIYFSIAMMREYSFKHLWSDELRANSFQYPITVTIPLTFEHQIGL